MHLLNLWGDKVFTKYFVNTVIYFFSSAELTLHSWVNPGGLLYIILLIHTRFDVLVFFSSTLMRNIAL